MLLAENEEEKRLWWFEKHETDLEKGEVKLLHSDASHMNFIFYRKKCGASQHGGLLFFSHI